MYKLCHLSLLWFMIIGGCKPTNLNNNALQINSTNKTAVNNFHSGFKKLAEEKLGKEVSYAMNDSQTMVLCKKVEKGTAPAMVNVVQFLVIHVKDNAIVYQDRIANGNVDWHDTTQLSISLIPGTIQGIPDKQSRYYLYDVETKQKLLPGAEKF